jgi:hypothetical protein
MNPQIVQIVLIIVGALLLFFAVTVLLSVRDSLKHTRDRW